MDRELHTMAISLTPAQRALALRRTAADVLIGVFAIGLGGGRSTAPGGGNTAGLGNPAAGSNGSGGAGVDTTSARLTSASGSGRITVTGTGTVTGVPNQLILSIGVQVKAASVSTALSDANQAVSRV